MIYKESSLFIGMPCSESLINSLQNESSQKLLSFFVGSNEDYLKRVTFEDICYLGKPIGKLASLSKIKLIEENIYSLLAKIAPGYPFKDTQLKLFALFVENENRESNDNK